MSFSVKWAYFNLAAVSHISPSSRLNIVVTRPAHQADMLCQLIEDAGHHALRLPVMAIEYIESPLTDMTIGALNCIDLVIATSANIAHTAQSLAQQTPAARWIAIGPKTAATLKKMGIAASHSSSHYHSESALRHPELQQIKGHNILILKGEGGRALLSDTLKDRGANITEIAVYRRSLFTPTNAEIQAALEQGEILTATSVETLKNLIQVTPSPAQPALLKKTLLVGGQRIAAAATTLGFTAAPIIAASPADQDMLTALLAYTDTRNP